MYRLYQLPLGPLTEEHHGIDEAERLGASLLLGPHSDDECQGSPVFHVTTNDGVASGLRGDQAV